MREENSSHTERINYKDEEKTPHTSDYRFPGREGQGEGERESKGSLSGAFGRGRADEKGPSKWGGEGCWVQ